MAHVIGDECVSCGSCEAECPVGAISQGAEHYEIDADACKICMVRPIDCVLLECGHMVTCTDCGKVLPECKFHCFHLVIFLMIFFQGPICRQFV